MATVSHVKGYDQFLTFFKDYKSDKVTNVLFTGEVDEDGNSWCPDCVEAKPFINEALDKYGDNTNFVFVDVGDRYLTNNIFLKFIDYS